MRHFLLLFSFLFFLGRADNRRFQPQTQTAEQQQRLDRLQSHDATAEPVAANGNSNSSNNNGVVLKLNQADLESKYFDSD